MSEPETKEPGANRRRSTRLRIACAGLVGVIIVIAAGAAAFWLQTKKPVMPGSVSAAEYQKASDEFARLFRREPATEDVLMLLAEMAIHDSRLQQAVDCFARIPSDHSRYGLSSRFQEAQILLRLNLADQAENSFRIFLQLSQNRTARDPEQILLARKWLVFLLAVELRFEERKEILRQMIVDRQFDVYDAKQLYFPSLLIWQSNLGSSRLQEFLKKDPDNRRLLTAQARYLVGEGNPDAADRLLQKLRQQNPADPAVIAASLECSFEKSNWEEFSKHFSQVGEFSESEPWLLTLMRGEFALHNHEWDAAERWFQHVLTADPANPVCHMGLTKVLREQGRNEARLAMEQRSLTLAKIRVNLASVDNTTVEAALTLASDARSLQMLEAADAFETLAARMSHR